VIDAADLVDDSPSSGPICEGPTECISFTGAHSHDIAKRRLKAIMREAKQAQGERRRSMSGSRRLITLLTVLFVIGLAGVARGNDGDPVIAGQTVTAQRTTEILFPDITTGEPAFLVDAEGADSTPGIEGRSYSGTGVTGTSPAGNGVMGQGYAGVHGLNETEVGYPYGVGVLAESVSYNGLYGVGLQSIGQVQFGQSSGLAVIAAGRDRVGVDLHIGLSSESMVLATSQSAGGRVAFVKKYPLTNRIVIVLASPAATKTLVAWFVIGPCCKS
jgi:hypothetical protein